MHLRIPMTKIGAVGHNGSEITEVGQQFNEVGVSYQYSAVV